MRRVLLLIGILLATTSAVSGTEPAEYYRARGDHFYRIKNIPEAILNYQKALQKNPGYAECYYQLGEIYLEKKLYSLSISSFEQVLKYRSNISDKTLILDTYFRLAKIWLLSDSVRTDPDIRLGLSKMIGYVDRVITSLTNDNDFKPVKTSRNYTVNSHYYLARALFIKGRYLRDMRQNELYSRYFQQSFNEMKKDLENYFKKTAFELTLDSFIKQLAQLRLKQGREWARAKPLIMNMSYCLYYIWEYNYHLGKRTLAARYKQFAETLNPQVFRMQLDQPYFRIFRKKNP